MKIWNILLIILIVLIVILVVLYYFGRKLQKQQAEQQTLMEAAKQTVSILVIDKKKLKIKESGLPKMVIDQTPWYMRRAKLPIVKAKIGPKVMTLIADEKAFCAAAKKYNLLLVPGSSFACPGYVRLAYCVAYETIVNSLPKFRELAKEYF